MSQRGCDWIELPSVVPEKNLIGRSGVGAHVLSDVSQRKVRPTARVQQQPDSDVILRSVSRSFPSPMLHAPLQGGISSGRIEARVENL